MAEDNDTPREGQDGMLPNDLRELLSRAERDESDVPVYDPDAEDEAGMDDGAEDDADEKLELAADNRPDGDSVDIHGGRLQMHEFGHEMEQSFIEYSMSVITARALPDVRDGLKPVHRRILYAMNEAGIFPNKPHKKSAWTVGEVIGKYHPHGDSAVYDAMVRLAQWFSMRVTLVDGHGNFGNIDGDSAAAMRYTESRLARPAMELLRDLNKDTVDWNPNYDESLQEPSVLPARFPNLLVNGSQGIAVGMATNIPPHNLGEAIDATCLLIDNPDATTDDLMRVMPGPDFPTGAVIMGSEGIRQAYETGRGILTVRAKAHVESTKGGRNKLVFTEFPYGVNKGTLQEKIAQLVNDKRIEGISDMRDESNRKGLRLVIELKQGVIPEVVLNNLYKYSSLQTSFGIIDLALVNGVPKLLSLKEMLQCYIDHQVEVVTRRTRFDLAKAQARAHILEGLLIALDNIDEVISIIRSSRTDTEASERMIARFGFTKEQTTAILEMRLRRLTGLERDKIQEELDGLRRAIAYYEELLADERKILGVIKTEMGEIREKYADKRRTTISDAPVALDVEDLIAEEDMVITVTHSGYVKRLPVSTYRSQKRGGKGIQGLSLKDNDFVEDLFVASTHDYVLFFTNKGKVYRVKVHELPIGSRHARGSALINVIPLAEGERAAAVITTREFPEDEYLLFATSKGMVKKTAMSDYDKSRRDGIIAINLKKDDELVNVRRVKQGENVILCTDAGKAIRFDEGEVRPTGRDTSGVRGITLRDDARMLGMEISNGKGDLLVVTEKGYGKRTPVSEYPEHKRGGQGVFTIAMTSKKGNLVACRVVGPQHELMMVSEEGVVIRVKTSDISLLGRSTQGVKIMNIGESDRVSAVARMIARKKKAPKANVNQGMLDLGAAGARDADDEDPIDIGGEEELDESLIEDDDE
ncbi:DNA gyrase, A subunit [Olsenella sp. oral taxon 809 str. F0356]|uniref:DNA gyrase subunit A n=1 Tax=Olsenella sp. oral taxon 809 TaxID=661086 RepID=UPI000231F006|nr:DNA gyrase, A subunit [Olsenella sp. oral taxon 809 str. F0356]